MERKKRGRRRRREEEEDIKEEEEEEQDTKEEKHKTDLWWYANPDGFFGEKNVKGPFETKFMRVWSKFNYFDSNFIMRKGK